MNPTEDLLESELKRILAGLKDANRLNEEDPSQTKLVQMIQQFRAQMVDCAALAFMAKPGNSKLLDAINSTIGQMEKSVRDDRKERAKAQEKEDNRATFNQLFEAMRLIGDGTLPRNEWADELYFLKPGLSFTEVADIGKIKEDEVRMGTVNTDIDGNVI